MPTLQQVDDSDVCICVYHLPLPWIPWSLLLVWLVHWAVPRRARWSTSTMTSAQTWSWWRNVSRYPPSVSFFLSLFITLCVCLSLALRSPCVLFWLFCLRCLLHALVCPVIKTTEISLHSSLLCWPPCYPCYPGGASWYPSLPLGMSAALGL